jgi:hypothetical protein
MGGKSAQKNANVLYKGRDENPVVCLQITAQGGLKLPDGSITEPKLVGRLYFELRNDIAPVCCANFLGLVSNLKGYGRDGTPYRYEGTKIHRIVRDGLFQGGDLLGR